MAILQIVKEGNELLRMKSRPVEIINDRIIRLLDDMHETMSNLNGAGLAAVQVGVIRRVVVIEVEDKLYELINPEIIETSGNQQEIEGCLSIPKKWGYTSRPAKVTVKALNRKGEEVVYTGEGMLARAFCHELDHLDGKLFIDDAVHMLTKEEMEEKFE